MKRIDAIKLLSAADFAEWLVSRVHCECCAHENKDCFRDTGITCRDGVAKWLEMEVTTSDGMDVSAK